MNWLAGVVPSPPPSASPAPIVPSDLWWDGYHTGMWIAFLIAAALIVAFWLGWAVGKGRIGGSAKVPHVWTSLSGQRNT